MKLTPENQGARAGSPPQERPHQPRWKCGDTQLCPTGWGPSFLFSTRRGWAKAVSRTPPHFWARWPIGGGALRGPVRRNEVQTDRQKDAGGCSQHPGGGASRGPPAGGGLSTQRSPASCQHPRGGGSAFLDTLASRWTDVLPRTKLVCSQPVWGLFQIRSFAGWLLGPALIFL